ncbi:MAG: lipopolysaccharide heptosyltransferase I [Pyrinomonadaceae bacterium]
MRILVVKLGSIGDIVHTLPSLAAIRAALPDCEISWVAEKRSAEILRGNRLIDRLIEIDTRSLRSGKVVAEILPRFREQFRALRRSRFDVAIDFQGLLKSAAIAKLSGAKRRYGFARGSLREPASRIFLTHGVEVEGSVHVIRKNLRLAAESLGIPVPKGDFEFPISTEAVHVQEAEEIAATSGGEFAILNPAGGWVTKLWPAENYGRLADELWERSGIRSIVAVGPDEAELGVAAINASRAGRAVMAQPSLKGFVELAKLARIYIGGDTGPTHLAVAAGAPVVGIFGPTEWWRNGSPNPADICVERTDIGCRVDCHRRVCSNWICMDIGVERVVSAVEMRLAPQILQETGI